MEDIKIVGLSPKKTSSPNRKLISAIVGVIVLSIGVIAGILLVRQQQDLREKASGNCDTPETIVKCPAPDGNLYTCNPPDQNNNAQIQSCNLAGRVELCGVNTNVVEYCCPVAGGTWTIDMAACSCKAKAPTSPTALQITGTSATIKWTAGSGGTTTRLWVSKNPDPTGTCGTDTASCVANDIKLAMTVSEYQLTNLTPNTRYYYRLMTSAESGCDEGTQVLNFTTTTEQVATATATATSVATRTATATSTARATATATSVATRTATATATATSTTTSASKTATPTSTTKATSTSSSSQTTTTAAPLPETGAEWPTVIGAGFGIIMLLVSLALAL
ncbi:MAG: fibronectin type III domain-containing protein [Patescibacteria group bacterium]